MTITGQKSMGITILTIMSRQLYLPVVKTSDYWLKVTEFTSKRALYFLYIEKKSYENNINSFERLLFSN